MRKFISAMLSLVVSAAFADSAATYHKLSWSVPASSIKAVDAKYVSVYAEVDGVRVGSDGRSAYGAQETGVTAETLVQGDGGWDWTGKDISSATFAVEFLSADLGVIATSSPVAYSALVTADAFEINGTGSFIPVNGTGTYSFEGTTVDSDGIWEELKLVFGDYGTVVPVANADGDIVSHTVTLTNGMTGPVVLKGNLGAVTIDLNGLSILGTNAVNGAESAGGNAIEVAGMLDPDTAKLTRLTIVNNGATGYTATLAGGNGADNGTGTTGGYAISVSNGLAGVTVTVGSNVTVKGGASGNSMTNATATAGIAALDNATLSSGTVSAGDDGTAISAWAWAKCTYSGEIPEGTTQVGDTLYFWKRNSGSMATYDFDVLDGQTVTDGNVYFADGTIDVDSFELTSSAGSLTFVGGNGTVLAASTAKSVFSIDAASDQTLGWTNISFTSSARVSFAHNGCAISVDGGTVGIVDCCFTNCLSEQLGGAVSLTRLDGDSRIASCDFTCNGVSGVNCYGGALYASSATNASEAATLSIADCTFTDNAAQRGGAISTLTSYDDDEAAITLAITDTLFSGNEAVWAGGAIDAEGDLTVDALATHSNPGSSTFTNNLSGCWGGAICFTGAENELTPVDVILGRGVEFACNTVSNDWCDAYGAAIEIMIPGSTFAATGVAFRNNRACGDGADNAGVYGGAFDSDTATNTFDTCVFDGNSVIALNNSDCYYGGAIFAMGGKTFVKNSTFRNQNVEAVVVTAGCDAELLNDVLVGNFTSDDSVTCDFLVSASDVRLTYCAWGAYENLNDAVITADEFNLSNRTTVIYASDDSLHLATNAFNSVAALGLVQPGVYDFDSVEYGSFAKGYSMGAFEAPARPAEINIAGTKTYDGHANSNGCTWVYTCTETDGDFAALGSLESLVTITEWTHAAKDAGSYAAPATLTVSVAGNSAEVTRWMEYGLITFTYGGTINRRPVSEGGLEIVLTPDEYPYTGNNVLANLVVTDTLPDDDETLSDGTDFGLSYSNNVNPTASAVVTVDTLRNYTDATNLLYAITAYFVEYTYDGVVQEDLTKIYGETSGVAVAVADGDYLSPVPTGLCLDYQWSATNDVVRRYDHTDGLLRLQVRYCADSNGDSVPDKYQRQILAKIVNGEWTENAASDQIRWATLYGSDGKWSSTGSGTLDAAVPTPGNPIKGFATGGWLAFVNGTLTQVDPASVDASTLSVPFLLYAYSHATSSGGRGGLGGRGGSTSATTKTLLEQYSSSLKLTDAKVTGSRYVLTAKLVVQDNTSGETQDIPLDDSRIKVYLAETLGDEWMVEEHTPESDGKIHVNMTGKSGFYKIGL